MNAWATVLWRRCVMWMFEGLAVGIDWAVSLALWAALSFPGLGCKTWATAWLPRGWLRGFDWDALRCWVVLLGWGSGSRTGAGVRAGAVEQRRR